MDIDNTVSNDELEEAPDSSPEDSGTLFRGAHFARPASETTSDDAASQASADDATDHVALDANESDKPAETDLGNADVDETAAPDEAAAPNSFDAEATLLLDEVHQGVAATQEAEAAEAAQARPAAPGSEVSASAEATVFMPASAFVDAAEAAAPATQLTHEQRAALVSLPDPEADVFVPTPTSAGDVTIAMAANLDGDDPFATTGLNAHDTFTNMEALPDDAGFVPSGEGFSATPIEQSFEAYQTGVAEEAHKKKGGVFKRILIVVAALAAAAGLVYVGGGLYFSSHFMPNTTVNGENVSGMSVKSLSEYVTSIGTNYETHVTGDGIDATIKGPDIDYTCDGDGYAAEAQAQISPWDWPQTITDDHEFTATQSTSYNQEKLDALLDDIVKKTNDGASQPTNATMVFDESEKKFVVKDQEYGTAVERDAVVSAVSEGVKTLKESIELGDEELVQPAVWNDDEKLVANVEKANKVMTSNVVLRIANADAVTLDAERVRPWISMNENTDLVLNREEIKKWTQGELSDQFDTVGTKRNFERPDGKKIEVEGGTYGWILDGEALSNVIADNFEAGNADPIEVPMKLSAANWAPGGKEWPNRYIDVDLTEQVARMYDDNSNLIWETSCVSGNPKYGGGTSCGVDYIYEKDSPMILIGNDYDHDGQPDYKTPVDFWMPFEGGQGLHDASWRYYFGGNIYSYDGSHGCVNLPYDKARELYDLTNVGDVVIVHW